MPDPGPGFVPFLLLEAPKKPRRGVRCPASDRRVTEGLFLYKELVHMPAGADQSEVCREGQPAQGRLREE